METMIDGCLSISYCGQLCKILRTAVINHISCTHQSGSSSFSDILLTMVTFRKAVFRCTVSACIVMLYLGWKYRAMLGVSHHPSVCLSVCPSKPLLPTSFALCHPVKVIAIYWVGVICQSQPDTLCGGTGWGTRWWVFTTYCKLTESQKNAVTVTKKGENQKIQFVSCAVNF